MEMNSSDNDHLDHCGNGANVQSDSLQAYRPECDPSLKPYVGETFRSIEDAGHFYRLYGAACGFDVRLGSNKRWNDGTIMLKYFFCNREGVKDDVGDTIGKGEGTKRRRHKVMRRFSCMARLVIRLDAPEGYVVKKFIEEHTHPLFPEAYKHLLNFNRKLDVAHEKFILNCARANIGSVKSYRLFKEMVGSYSNVGCDISDFKNFSRDLRAFVVGSDAQMMLEKLFRRRELCSAYCVEFFLDEHDKLKRLFWCDPISKRNYHSFGETNTFDATYGMNRYNMIFTPFTGKDNHGNCVTFGASLLSSEDVESYSWMLEKYISCMGRHPKMIITDQDPALKVVVAQIMPGTRHRLCMWHIMDKVSSKIPRTVKEETDFLKDFYAMVWADNTEPSAFEQNWHEIIEFYDLANVDWLATMFEIHESWLPAYFRDFPMSGLFRTKSMSESMNSFFGSFGRSKADLAEFLMHFDSAMDKQRNDFDRLTKEDITSLPVLKTDLALERHAASIFTVGFICSHMFAVFKNYNFESIPDAYIVNRWRKNACSLPVKDMTRGCGVAYVDSSKEAIDNLHSIYYNLVGSVEGDPQKIDALTCYLEKYKESVYPSGKYVVERRKERMFGEYYGSTVPSEVSVLPPNTVKTKGSGSRLISRREKAA